MGSVRSQGMLPDSGPPDSEKGKEPSAPSLDQAEARGLCAAGLPRAPLGLLQRWLAAGPALLSCALLRRRAHLRPLAFAPRPVPSCCAAP